MKLSRKTKTETNKQKKQIDKWLEADKETQEIKKNISIQNN